MKRDNVVRDKAFSFAVEAVLVCRNLALEKRDFVLSRQLMKSATSIGANIEEAQGGQSLRDFIAKLSISYKEARETVYWLRILRETALLDENTICSLLPKAKELMRLLSSILLSSKKRLNS